MPDLLLISALKAGLDVKAIATHIVSSSSTLELASVSKRSQVVQSRAAARTTDILVCVCLPLQASCQSMKHDPSNYKVRSVLVLTFHSDLHIGSPSSPVAVGANEVPSDE